MTTRLQLYTDALRVCGERRLASLTEAREPRRLLDDAWDAGAIDYCLEQGLWNFATRAVKLAYSPSVTPDFGYARAFARPSDFIRTAAMSADEYFSVPLRAYEDTGGYWFADLDEIYVKYISNDAAYGADLSLWPETFSRWVGHYLASEIGPKLTAAQSRMEKMERDARRALVDARSKDAIADPTRFPPSGSWVGARRGRGFGDRGGRGGLIG